MAVSTEAWGSGADKAFQWYDDTPLSANGKDNIGWQNEPSTATPLSAENLNAHSKALDIIDDRVILLYNQVNALAMGLDEATSQFKLIYSVDNQNKENDEGVNDTVTLQDGQTYLLISSTFNISSKGAITFSDIGMSICACYNGVAGIKRINATSSVKLTCSGRNLTINVAKVKATKRVNIRIYRV